MAAEAQSRAPIFAAQDKCRELELEKEEEEKLKDWKEKKDKKCCYPTTTNTSLQRTFSPEDILLLPKKKEVWT